MWRLRTSRANGVHAAYSSESRERHAKVRRTIAEGFIMKVGTLVGLILVVLGVIGVAYGGISYTRKREVAHVGPVQVTAREEHTIPISPIVGGIAIIAGAALIIAVRRAS
jgi:hypothetical protein